MSDSIDRRSTRSVILSVVVGLLIAAVIGGIVWGVNALSVLDPDGALTGDTQREGVGTSGAREPQTHVVVDGAGRQVVLPLEPARIAVYDPFAGTVMVLAGAGEQLCGIPGGVASDTLIQRIYPGITEVTTVTGNTINIETVLDSGADIVIIRSSLYAAAGETEKLDTMDIPYVVAAYETVEQQVQAIEMIGLVCGAAAVEKAKGLAQYYRDTIALVEGRAAALSPDERLRVYHSINATTTTDAVGSLGADWIARVGCIDVSAGEQGVEGTGDFEATLEQVYAWAPDVIICNTVEARDTFLSDSRWAGLAAVENGRVYNLPISTSRWGQRGDPETYLAMVWLGCTLYPDLYSDIDLKQTVVDYYRDYVGLAIDDATWDAIVSGVGVRTTGGGGGSGSGSGSGTGSGSGSGSGTGGGSGGGTGSGSGSGSGN